MSNDYYSDSSAGLAFLLLLIPVILIAGVIFYVIYAFLLMKVFEKAGVEGKWRAWVPVYNTMIFGKLGDLSPWVVLAAIVASAVLGQIPVIGWIFGVVVLAAQVMYSWRVGLKLGTEWYLLLLWLIPGVGLLIWLGILAFGSSRWNTSIAPAPWANSFLADKTDWQGIPAQNSTGGYHQPGQPGFRQPGHAPGTQAPGAYPPPPAGDNPPAPGGTTPPPAPGAPTPPEPPRSF